MVHFTEVSDQKLSLVLYMNPFAQSDQTVIRGEEKVVSLQRVSNEATPVGHVGSLCK